MKPICKRIICILLALFLLGSLAVSAFAEDTTNSTSGSATSSTVTYDANRSEEWTVTVPATLTAGGSAGNIEVTGFWPSNRQLEITVDSTVTMHSDILNTNTTTAAVTFTTITVPGSNTSKIEKTGEKAYKDAIQVGTPEGTLIGTWTGTLDYAIAIENVPAST